MAVKVIIDAGHGGYDSGAVYNGRLEKDDNLRLALAVGAILKNDGYDVVYTRTEDVYDSPTQKARIGNESGADFFVSIHRNSSPTPNSLNGVQTLVYDLNGIKAEMAENVNSKLEEVGYRNINVDVRKDLAVLRRTRMPAILVEAGFINSDTDNQLFDEKFWETADAIAEGINETIREAGLMSDASESAYVMSYGSKSRTSPYENSGMAVKAAAMDNGTDNGNSGGTPGNTDDAIYQILTGVYDNFGTARYQMNRLINEGYTAEIYEQGAYYQVRVGEYDDIEDALVAQKTLRDAGYDTLIVRV